MGSLLILSVTPHPAEEPTKAGGKDNEGAAEYYAQRRPISWKFPEGK